MKILSSIFKPKKVRDTLFALNSLSQSFQECWGFSNEIAVVRRLVIDNPDPTRRSIILERREPLQLALILIQNHCIKELSNGSHQMYGGRLSFRGQNLLQIYITAISQMVERGYMTADDAAKEKKGMMAIIESLR